MPGLIDSLYIAASALNAQQQSVEVAGQNLANVNNSAYSRQVVVEQAATPVETSAGQEGTGVDVVAIQQIRDSMLDNQIQGENSITSFLQTQQTALQTAQSDIGEQLASTSSTDTDSVGSTGGLDSGLSTLFNDFQTLSTDPSSTANRQTVISQAQQVAAQFNQVDQSLSGLKSQLNQSVQTDVGSANQLLTQIAGLNQQIMLAQGSSGGTANDLVDLREKDLESLSNLVNFQPVANSDGSVNVVVGGQLLVSGSSVQDTLQAYDAGGGQMLVGTSANPGTPLTLTGGSIQGAIDTRDNALTSLQGGLNQLASQLITQVNAVYTTGYDLNGNTGADLFTGTDASDIGVNATLASDPSTFQAAGVSGASGDNQVAVALAQLGSASQSSLGNQTFSGSYNATITDLGTALSNANSNLSDQQAVQSMLSEQRTSVSGVSLNDEMTNLMTYQQAFEASAELVNTINTMLGDLMSAKQS
ncbi:MAG: flagellar hook-associated protein FlgK [Limisphaerales bacterium]